MNLLEIVEIRDKLKAELAVVEKFLEIAKAHGANGRNGSAISQDGNTLESRQVNPDKQRNLQLRGADKEYGSISDAVREAIRLAPERYTIRSVSAILDKINKPLSKVQIGTVLGRFSEKGEVHIQKKGKGSKPTVYRKPQVTVSG